MMRKLATIGACATILLGSAAVSANAKSGGGGSASFGAGGHTGSGGHASSGTGHAGSTGGNSDGSGHGGPVGFANGQFAPSGTPPCQPGVCPGRSQ
jgi:two-component system, chemotaxis family, sensor kinase CheA